MKTIHYLKENYWLVIILTLGAFLRFYKLDFQSVWLDEIHTLNEANPNLSFSEVYNSVLTGEQMPPLYFYTVYFLFKIFGYTSFVVRFYSAVIGVISIYSIYVLGKELVNKKTGLIASLLLSLNIFHLYYSQEGRPYGFLALFTILAFYRLVKYIKRPNLKNSILYGFFAGLMLMSHFFGLFVLLSQAFIILVFLILTEKTKRAKFFINSAISAVVAFIVFIPAIKIFLKISEIKEFWIPPTDLKTIKQIFKDFCGNSDFILILAIIGLVYYCVLLIRDKNHKKSYNDVVENKLLLSSIILLSWIIIVLAVPILRSYLVIPMIISRYFIVILPAFILIISVAISECRNTIVRTIFLFLLAVGMFYETTIHSNYYSNVSKTQFREVTQFIIDNNKNNESVVTSLGWYLPYFLNKDKNKNTIVDKTLDIYVSEMSQDASKIRSFWYFDGHIRPFAPSETTKSFLEQHFVVDKNIDLFDCYSKHFILKSNYKPNIDIGKFIPLKQSNGDRVNFSIENFENKSDKIELNGWAYFDGQGMENSKIYIIAIKNNLPKVIPIENILREDVTSYFKSPFNLSNSGFKSEMLKSDFENGSYQIGILVQDTKNNKKGLVITDKSFNIQ